MRTPDKSPCSKVNPNLMSNFLLFVAGFLYVQAVIFARGSQCDLAVMALVLAVFLHIIAKRSKERRFNQAIARRDEILTSVIRKYAGN